MTADSPRRLKLPAVGLSLSVVAFAGELAIVLGGWGKVENFVVPMILFALPLFIMHLVGLILGVVAFRARKPARTAIAVLAIISGLIGLPITTVLVLFAGLSAASGWN